MFNVQRSKQENIVQNNISNSIKNRSINTQDTTVASNMVCNVNATQNVKAGVCGLPVKEIYPNGYVKEYTEPCPPLPDHPTGCVVNLTNIAECNQSDTQEISILSTTDQSFDTTVANNISNELKNAAKIETPSLLGGGLFSSQANNQINKSVNNETTNIENDIRTMRKQLIVSNSTANANPVQNVPVPSGCGVKVNARNRGKIAQESMKQITLKYFDKVRVSNDVENKIKNDLGNTATIGPSIIVAAMTGVCFVVYFFKKKTQSAGSKLSSSVTAFIYIVLSLIIGFTIYYCFVISKIMNNDDSFYFTIKCADSYRGTATSKIQKNVDDCASGLYGGKGWEKIRGDRENFNRWKVEDKKTVTDNADSASLRGVIWDEGLNKSVDYTTLNYDPFSSIDCGENGLQSKGDRIEGCRTIEEDYQWENILKQSCGCCSCNPEYIDYHVPDPSKVLDGGESTGEHIDKSLELLQPGTGYKNSGGSGIYETSCMRLDGSPCKKKSANGDVEDLLDGDGDNIKVKLLSHESCSSKGGNYDDYALKCYEAAPNTSLNTQNLVNAVTNNDDLHPIFGLPATPAVRCNMVTDGVLNTVMGALGACPFADDQNPNGCVRADKCEIDFKENHPSTPGVALGSGKEHCTSNRWLPADRNKYDGDEGNLSPSDDACVYSLGGVKDILIHGKSPNHIDSPDHIYTIKKQEGDQDGLTTYFHLHDSNDLEEVSAVLSSETGEARTWWKDPGSNSSVAPNIFAASSRLITTEGTVGGGRGGYAKVKSISCGNVEDVAVPGQNIITNALFDGTPFSSEKTSGEGTDLCLAKFRRLPACAKDEQGNDKTEFGCGSIYSPDEKCLLCENDNNSNDKANPVSYNKQLNWEGSFDDSFFLTKPSKNKGGWTIVWWTILLVIIWIVSILALYFYIRFIISRVMGEVARGAAEGFSGTE